MSSPDDAYEQLFPDPNVPDAPPQLPPTLPSLKPPEDPAKTTKSLSVAPPRDDDAKLSLKGVSKEMSKNENKEGKLKKEIDAKNLKKKNKNLTIILVISILCLLIGVGGLIFALFSFPEGVD